MRRLTAAIVLLFLILTSQGQEISKHEEDSLLTSLSKVNTDKERMSILCQLAEYQIFKPGEYKADLDSAEAYLDEAARLNGRVGSIDAKGFQTLIMSRLTRERGNDTLARAEAEKSRSNLKNRSEQSPFGPRLSRFGFFLLCSRPSPVARDGTFGRFGKRTVRTSRQYQPAGQLPGIPGQSVYSGAC